MPMEDPRTNSMNAPVFHTKQECSWKSVHTLPLSFSWVYFFLWCVYVHIRVCLCDCVCVRMCAPRCPCTLTQRIGENTGCLGHSRDGFSNPKLTPGLLAAQRTSGIPVSLSHGAPGTHGCLAFHVGAEDSHRSLSLHCKCSYPLGHLPPSTLVF